MTRKMRLAILISGKGSNMLAIAQNCLSERLNAIVALVASDNENATGLATASALGLPTTVLPYPDKKKSEALLAQEIHLRQIDCIVLAGFMKILSPSFVEIFRGKIVNIHPSLLPSFPGAQAIRDAWEFGVKITGVTVHLVDEQVDHGAILAQEALPILPSDTIESLEERIHLLEHRLYTETLHHLLEQMPFKE